MGSAALTRSPALHPQIRGPDRRVLEQVAGRAFEGGATVLEDVAAAGEAQGELEVLLDQQNRDALPKREQDYPGHPTQARRQQAERA
jgi:hypothetical protein